MTGIVAAVAGSIIPAIGGDSYFRYVTLLLHGNSTNNANNNSFVDSSSNALTITRNVTPTQGSFGPYGSNWSNYFDGATDDITVADNAAFDVGSGDFTIEMWIYPEGQAGLGVVFSQNSGSEATSSYDIRYDGNTTLSGYIFVGSTPYSAAETITKNQWQHVAFVRNGNTIRLYVNGTSTTSTSVSGTVNNSSIAIYVGSARTAGGYYFKGYISNVRFVKGTAVYTSNFTPSTAPLTAISGTQFLTCQSNRFIDNSTNAFTITRNGDVSVQQFSPFAPSAAYSTSTNGGSLFFDNASGSCVTVPITSGGVLDIGSSDYTIEGWCYFTDWNSLNNIFGTASVNNYFGPRSNGATIEFQDASATQYNFSCTVHLRAWQHIALCRSGTSMKCFVNGVQVGSTQTTSTSPFNQSSSPLRVGEYANDGNNFRGYLTDFRVLKGTALYTSNFTPPSTKLTSITNTSLLLSGTNAGIIDNAMITDPQTVGNARISTTQSKFGDSSIYFDGTGDNLKFPPNVPALTLGSGDFTVETWVYFNAVSGLPVIFDQRPVSTNGAYPLLYVNSDSGNALTWYVSSTARIIGSAMSTGTWYHIAVSRSGTSTKMFVDGTQVGSTYTDTTNYLYSFMSIGSASYADLYYLNGYIDDFRITKGYARYTTNFTPPTTAFADK